MFPEWLVLALSLAGGVIGGLVYKYTDTSPRMNPFVYEVRFIQHRPEAPAIYLGHEGESYHTPWMRMAPRSRDYWSASRKARSYVATLNEGPELPGIWQWRVIDERDPGPYLLSYEIFEKEPHHE